MNPALPELLTGLAIAIATPAPPESAGDYMAGRLGIVAMIAGLAAQEAEVGPAVRLWESDAIGELLAQALAQYDAGLGGQMSAALQAARENTDFSWSGLDAVNATLRRALIALHEAVEAAADRAVDRRILELYAQMAERRRLRLPGE
ncbi:MAG TPA: hypothetical protein VG248_15570 [Caulobacteraceae bacterium]|nr:hypothetical protein [Caulobacteraceae bacterium]